MRVAIALTAITLLGCASLVLAQATSVPYVDGPGIRRGGTAETSASGNQAHQTQAIYSRQAVFAIPFTVAQPNRNALEVLLFVSADRGATWDLYARESAVKGQFGFRAGRDGEYWFASRTVPAGTNLPNHSTLGAELKVVVDTSEPKLNVEASVNHSGQIEVTWDATDNQLAPESLKVEYQSALGQPWRSARVDKPAGSAGGSSLKGTATWEPEGGGRFVSIRVQVSDASGNVAQAVRRLLVPTTVAGNPSTSPRTHSAADVPQDPLANHGLMPGHMAHLPSGSPQTGQTGSQTRTVQDDYDQLFTSSYGSSSYGADGPDGGTSESATEDSAGLGWESYEASTYGPRDQRVADDESDDGESDDQAWESYGTSTYGPRDQRVADDESDDGESDDQGWGRYGSDTTSDRDTDRVTWPSDADGAVRYDRPRTGFASSGRDYGTAEDPYGQNTANTDTGDTARESSDDPPGEETPAYGLPEGERPRMTSSTRFNLAYSVDAAGPMGLEKVELWVTRNGGREWNLWGIDEDMESPFLVELEDEGIYGFRVVIVSNNGLASQTPRSGDLADLWVGIDVTGPEAEITTAAYGSGGHAGHLDIQWTATDDHLGQRPITLSFSEKRNGPWTAIASGLPNTGQYHWRVDSSVPDKFYLRLEVRDEAGNLHVDQLKRPLQSAGLTPKGRVRSFEPLSE